MKPSGKVLKALDVAAKAHHGQFRKGTDIPYIIHPVAVMAFASTVTDNENVLCASLLHDVLEDCDPTLYGEDFLSPIFGDEVVNIVKIVSKDDQIADWRARSQKYLDNVRSSRNQSALIVCAADKVHNLTTTISDYQNIGDKLWPRFGAGKNEQLWWYQAVYKLLKKELPGNPLTEELGRLVAKLKRDAFRTKNRPARGGGHR